MKLLLLLSLLGALATAQEIPAITAGTAGHNVILTVANGSPALPLRAVRVAPGRVPGGLRLSPAEVRWDALPPAEEREAVFTLAAGNDVRLTGNDTLTLLIRSAEGTTVERVFLLRFVPPEAFALGEPYPNPFNPTAECELRIAEWANTRVVLYDLLGREVRVIREEVLPPGVYPLGIDGAALASGVYFLRMTASPVDGSGGYSAVRRLALVR